MRRVVGIAAFVLLGGLTISGGTVAGATERFNGQNSGTTAEFAFDGPWTLDWEATSDYPLAAEFEMRLLDAETGRVVGTILQIEGAASGLRLFTESGTFRIEVIASYVDWTLEVEPVSAAVAAQLQQGTKQAPTLEEPLDNGDGDDDAHDLGTEVHQQRAHGGLDAEHEGDPEHRPRDGEEPRDQNGSHHMSYLLVTKTGCVQATSPRELVTRART